MFDINAARLPIHCNRNICPYVGENNIQTLTRSERLARHPSDDVPTVLMCCVLLAFVERRMPDLPFVRSYDTKVTPSLLNAYLVKQLY